MANSYAYKSDPAGNPLSFLMVGGAAADGMEAANQESFAGIEGSNLIDASIIAQIREALLRVRKWPLIPNGVAWVDALIADTIQAQLDGQKLEISGKFAGASSPANSLSHRCGRVESSAIEEVKAALAQRMPLAFAERAAQAVVRKVIVTDGPRRRGQRPAADLVQRVVSDAPRLAA